MTPRKVLGLDLTVLSNLTECCAFEIVNLERPDILGFWPARPRGEVYDLGIHAKIKLPHYIAMGQETEKEGFSNDLLCNVQKHYVLTPRRVLGLDLIVLSNLTECCAFEIVNLERLDILGFWPARLKIIISYIDTFQYVVPTSSFQYSNTCRGQRHTAATPTPARANDFQGQARLRPHKRPPNVCKKQFQGSG